MKTVKIRDIVIGEGMPKICVPITESTKEAIIKEAKAVTALPADMAEWRVDHFEHAPDIDEIKDALKSLRKALGDMPLLMTFRTSHEGGGKEIDVDTYASINIEVAKTGCVDMIDVEIFRGDEVASSIIEAAHSAGVRVIASSHDFDKTPDKEEMIAGLCKMQDAGADIAKIAVMPRSRHDVLTLMAASEEMNRKHAKCPVIAISMGDMGIISRIAGETFGSAVTFGAGSNASAPGQIGANELKTVLSLIHICIPD